MATKFRYPTGVRPLLREETARRRRIESRFVEALEQAGFDEIVLPIIDFVEPYAQVTDRRSSRQSYRFVDRDGELVAIRSDFTPMVARALAPTLTDVVLPLRVFYRGDVIRCEASRLGANRELFQIGAEIIGDPTAAADVAALTMAAEIVRGFGFHPLVVYNDVSIAAQLVAAAGDEGEVVRRALFAKRAQDLGDVGRKLPLIGKLAAGTATLDDVAAFAPAAAERLRAIDEALGGEGGDATFVLHLDDVDDADLGNLPDDGDGEKGSYYTGLRFRVFGNDSRRPVAQGGRYDTLYARFGTSAPAIGFTFTIDDLEPDMNVKESA